MNSPEAQPPALALGARVELFTPARANIYVGFVLGTLIAVGGLVLAGLGLAQVPTVIAAPTPQAREGAIGSLISGLLIGGVLTFLRAAGVWVSRSLLGTGIEVCENGLRWLPVKTGSDAVPWADVARIEERFLREDIPAELVVGLLFRPIAARHLLIVHPDGRQFTINREVISRVGLLAKRLRTAADAHAIPWVEQPG